MNGAARISFGGFLATAVAYGPARMGFGLFLPQFRETFGLSLQTAGFIAGGAFAAFLAALLAAAAAAGRAEPRALVVAGCAAGTLGLAIVAAAPGTAALAAGTALAAMSAGLAWTPFNTATRLSVRPALQPRVLAVVSTGTTLGIAAAATLALGVALSGLSWRTSWAVFAAAGAVATFVNVVALGRQTPDSAPRDMPLSRQIGPLRASPGREVALAAFSFGATSAVYLSFAADHVAGAGGLPGLPRETAGAAVFLSFGIGGIVGLATGEAERRTGIAPLMVGIFLASGMSMALLAALPGSWPAVAVSAALQGACLMAISALFSLATLRLFPSAPARGFCAVLTVFATGNVLATALAGIAAERAGLAATHGAAAALSVATALALALRPVRVPPDS